MLPVVLVGLGWLESPRRETKIPVSIPKTEDLKGRATSHWDSCLSFPRDLTCGGR